MGALKEYSKIETLYNRDKATFKVTDELRWQEFGLLAEWYVTEKVHGQNIRIHWDGENVSFGGRSSTNIKDLPGDLVKLLQGVFTVEKMRENFGAQIVTLYGEGYGAGINGGGNYSPTKQFILFDALFDDKWWLEPCALKELAPVLGVEYVHEYGMMTIPQIVDLVKSKAQSPLASAKTGKELVFEGIIAKAPLGLFTRAGRRLMFKLKVEDYKLASSSKQGCAKGALE